MREFILILLGLCIGILMAVWSAWHIVSYARADSCQRRQRRFYFRIALFVALIALGDLTKALRDLLLFLSG